jgi:hypothetical protein
MEDGDDGIIRDGISRCDFCEKNIPISDLQEVRVRKFFITKIKKGCTSCIREIQLKKIGIK